MARRRKKRIRHAARRVVHRVRHAARRSYHRARSVVGTSPKAIMISTGEAGVGLVGMNLLMGMLNTPTAAKPTPMLSPTMQTAAKAGLGVAGLFLVRNRHVKMVAAGSLLAAAIDVVTGLMTPKATVSGPWNPNAPRALNQAQMRRVGMGVPASIKMGVPSSVTMGASYDSPARGVSSSGWGNRSW